MPRKAALVVGFAAGAAIVAIVALACQSYDTIYGDPDASDASDAAPPITDVYVPPIQVDAPSDAPHDGQIDAPDVALDATPDAAFDAAVDATVDATGDAPLDAKEDAGLDAPDG